MADINEGRAGYKKTKVGWIPEEWGLKRLGDLMEFKNGVNASKGAYGKGTKFINVMEVINNGKLAYDQIPGSVSLDKNHITSNLIKYGDILFNRTSETNEEIGLTTVYLDNHEVVFGGFVIRGRFTSSSINHFFKEFCFRSRIMRKQIIARGQGAVRANISQKDLQEVLLPLPPLPEQRRIAAILSTWDEAIERLEALIERKQQRKRGLMQQLLTGRTRFPEFVPPGGTRYKDTKLGPVPADWEVVRLGDVAKTFSGGTPKTDRQEYYNGDIPWIRSGELNSFRVLQTEKTITNEGLSNSSAKIVEPGTILLALYGATAGVVSVTEIEAAINQAILAIIPERQIHNQFLEFFLRWYSPKIVHMYTQGGQPNLSATIIKSQVLPLPSLKEQDRIASILGSLDDESEYLKTKRQNLKIGKKGLMQQLLTGAVRVKT